MMQPMVVAWPDASEGMTDAAAAPARPTEGQRGVPASPNPTGGIHHEYVWSGSIFARWSSTWVATTPPTLLRQLGARRRNHHRHRALAQGVFSIVLVAVLLGTADSTGAAVIMRLVKVAPREEVVVCPKQHRHPHDFGIDRSVACTTVGKGEVADPASVSRKGFYCM